MRLHTCSSFSRPLALLFFLLITYISTTAAQSTIVKTVTAAQPTQTVSPEWTDDAKFKAAVLNGTNTYRQEHNATALKWNDTLEDAAQDWVNGCEFEHSGGPTGENLATGYANVTAAIAGWGDEREDYNFKSGGFSEKTGHFTQLVWKSTTTVGCARKNCGTLNDDDDNEGKAWGYYLVCEYYPPGNVQDAYKANVQSEESGAAGLRVGSWAIWGLLGLLWVVRFSGEV